MSVRNDNHNRPIIKYIQSILQKLIYAKLEESPYLCSVETWMSVVLETEKPYICNDYENTFNNLCICIVCNNSLFKPH